MVRSRLFQTWVLATLMLLGQVIPSHGTRCEGCLMHPSGRSELIATTSAPAPARCTQGCCGRSADQAEKPTKSESPPCDGHDKCDGKCNCPGACCSTGQLVALARFACVDLSLSLLDEPVLSAEARVCARDASLALLRPPRS